MSRWETRLWYVGAMNDALFVIDQKPQPAPIDYVCGLDHGVNVIAACGTNRELADLLVAEHNARVESQKALTFCRDIAGEELALCKVGTGAEVALRHIERRANEAVKVEARAT